jgi:hypothetical protein
MNQVGREIYIGALFLGIPNLGVGWPSGQRIYKGPHLTRRKEVALMNRYGRKSAKGIEITLLSDRLTGI